MREYPIKCAWCGTTIRFVDYPNSHGMCNPCLIINLLTAKFIIIRGEIEKMKEMVK